MKSHTATNAVALATLAREGFRPRGDLVLIAQADEEDGSEAVGMQWLVEARPDLRVDYAVDEGGGERIALSDGGVAVTVGVGEKACLPVLVTALGEAGHASTPYLAANAVPRLATLIGRIAAHRPQRTVLPVVRRMLEQLGADPDGDLDAAIAHVTVRAPRLADDLPALLAMTLAPTRLQGSSARNVLPARATVDVDARLLPGQTRADLERELRAALGDDIPYELDYPEPLSGGTISAIDVTALRGLRLVPRGARPRRHAAPLRQHRVRGLLLHAQRLGHGLRRLLADPHHPARGDAGRRPQPRRAHPRRRRRLRGALPAARRAHRRRLS